MKKKQKEQSEASFVKGMSKEDIAEAFQHAIPLLTTALVESHGRLKMQDEVDATALNDKFSASEGSFTFTYGGKFPFLFSFCLYVWMIGLCCIPLNL
jgi:hypothetical protein